MKSRAAFGLFIAVELMVAGSARADERIKPSLCSKSQPADAAAQDSISKDAIVFFIAGQSNAGGVAAFSPESNEKAGMQQKHPTIPGSTAKEVGIPTSTDAYPKSYIWGDGGFERLTPGKNLKGGYRDPGRHGIELPMAMLLERAYPQADKFIIKHGPGGHNLHTHWKAGVGPDYKIFKTQLDGSMADLKKRYKSVRTVGLYWDQGESDRPKARTTRRTCGRSLPRSARTPASRTFRSLSGSTSFNKATRASCPYSMHRSKSPRKIPTLICSTSISVPRRRTSKHGLGRTTMAT